MKITIVITLFCTYLSNNTLCDYFKRTEIRQLKNFVENFDSFILNKYKTEDNSLANSYKLFFDEIKRNETEVELIDQSVIHALKEGFVKLDQDLTNKIWIISKYREINDSTNIQTLINLRHNSHFVYYLQSDKRMEEYCNIIDNSGGISPSLVVLFLSIQEELDMNNFEDRLKVVVHYMSLINPLIPKGQIFVPIECSVTSSIK